MHAPPIFIGFQILNNDLVNEIRWSRRRHNLFFITKNHSLRKHGDRLLCPKAATRIRESTYDSGARWTERSVPIFSPLPQALPDALDGFINSP